MTCRTPHVARSIRRLFAIGGLAFLPIAALAQVSLVHVTSCGPKTFPATCSVPSTGSGNLLVVGWSSANGSMTIASVTDGAGNVYLEAGAAKSIDSVSNIMADVWYAKNSLSGASVLTITPSSSGTPGTAVIWEFSGADTNSPLNQTAVLNSQTVTTSAIGASVMTSASEVVVSVAAFQGSESGISAGNSFSNDSSASGDGWAHLITSSAGTYQPQWNSSSGGTYCSTTVSFKAASPGGGPCDLNLDGVANVVDVQLATNMSLGLISCPTNINGGVCGSGLVQQVVNAALGQGCSATISHSVSLTWTPSTSGNIAGYNIYRGTTSGGPYTKVNTALISPTAYADTSVGAGQTYYYVATAVDTSSNESGYSSQALANVPAP